MHESHIEFELVSALVLHWSYEQRCQIILSHYAVPSAHILVDLKVWQLLQSSNKALLFLIVDTEALVDRVELVAKLIAGGKN